MNYEEYDPTGLLAKYVKKCWSVSVDCCQDSQLIIPDGCIEVIFNFGDPIRKKSKKQDWTVQPRFFVAGQLTGAISLAFSGNVDIFAIRFWPHSFSPLVPWSIAESRDLDIPITDMWHCDIAERMWEVDSFEKRLILVQDFILNTARSQSNQFRRFEGVVCKELLSLENFRTAEISGISTRQLQRDFRQFVGLSPNEYFRIQRFNNTFNALQTKHRPLLEVVLDHGYYDQSHFYKDLKKYIGISDAEMNLTFNSIITNP